MNILSESVELMLEIKNIFDILFRYNFFHFLEK